VDLRQAQHIREHHCFMAMQTMAFQVLPEVAHGGVWHTPHLLIDAHYL
jgi:hypothetical protein